MFIMITIVTIIIVTIINNILDYTMLRHMI